MGFITKYGTAWGQIPQTSGNVFWVAPGAGGYTVEGRTYSASDDNDGLSPERALATINQAADNLVTAGRDVVVLLPGNHTPSASIALDTAGVTIWGLTAGKPKTLWQDVSILGVTGDQTINVTAEAVEIANCTIVPITEDTAIDFSAAANRLYIHDCRIDMVTPVVNIATIGIEALGAAQQVLIEDNYFISDGAQGHALNMTATTQSIVQNNIFHCTVGSWAIAMHVGAATDSLLIRSNTFNCSGTAITAGVDGTGATITAGVLAVSNRFGVLVGTPFDAFTGGECDLLDNFIATVSAGSGGTVITAST